mmetsp:Transcript_14413/g.24409  ORF Transcript_14413/g.24409 Transcript_14413/m.24409 type:complete len:314 (+) Transcript_14413:1378-2319(+)
MGQVERRRVRVRPPPCRFTHHADGLGLQQLLRRLLELLQEAVGEDHGHHLVAVGARVPRLGVARLLGHAHQPGGAELPPVAQRADALQRMHRARAVVLVHGQELRLLEAHGGWRCGANAFPPLGAVHAPLVHACCHGAQVAVQQMLRPAPVFAHFGNGVPDLLATHLAAHEEEVRAAREQLGREEVAHRQLILKPHGVRVAHRAHLPHRQVRVTPVVGGRAQAVRQALVEAHRRIAHHQIQSRRCERALHKSFENKRVALIVLVVVSCSDRSASEHHCVCAPRRTGSRKQSHLQLISDRRKVHLQISALHARL